MPQMRHFESFSKNVGHVSKNKNKTFTKKNLVTLKKGVLYENDVKSSKRHLVYKSVMKRIKIEYYL